MELDFINTELRESRLFRSPSAMEKRTAEDIKTITFLYFLTLAIMTNEFSTAPFAQDYLIKTFKHGSNFSRSNRTDTDLFWCLHVLITKNKDLLNKKFDKENELELSKIGIDKMRMLQWVKGSIKGSGTQSSTNRFLTGLENSLKITNADYKDLRRLISRWDDLNTQQKTIVCTRLLFALGKYARMSDIYPDFNKFVKDKGYKWNTAIDPETYQGGAGLKSFAKDLGMGAVTGLLMSFAAAKISHEDIRQKFRSVYKNLQETTTASSIGTMVMPIGTVVKRSNKKEKSIK